MIGKEKTIERRSHKSNIELPRIIAMLMMGGSCYRVSTLNTYQVHYTNKLKKVFGLLFSLGGEAGLTIFSILLI